ncbi:MAG: hypothetical protein JST47_02420 [Bacteroidetes bacterium]|nr:hypothetical protein [Bacteroidota bacterium]
MKSEKQQGINPHKMEEEMKSPQWQQVSFQQKIIPLFKIKDYLRKDNLSP